MPGLGGTLALSAPVRAAEKIQLRGPEDQSVLCVGLIVTAVARLCSTTYPAKGVLATMMLESDTHKVGFCIRAQIGRVLASCIDAWDHIRPPRGEFEEWLMRPVKPLPHQESQVSVPEAVDLAPVRSD